MKSPPFFLVLLAMMAAPLRLGAMEGREEKKTEEHYTTSQKFKINYWLIYGILAAITAAVLSWRCNSNANYPFSTKLLCSMTAFGYGTFYLIFYLIMYLNYKDALCVINP